jgi:hypothetical protein
MQILLFDEIIENGNSIFSIITELENQTLIVNFKGELRTEHPYKELEYFIENFGPTISELSLQDAHIDFTDLRYCNSNGFYIIVDIMDLIYSNCQGKITVRRLFDDDWHQETLPVLLNVHEEQNRERIIIEDANNV